MSVFGTDGSASGISLPLTITNIRSLSEDSTLTEAAVSISIL